jgi:hypothetical protein
MSSWAKRTLTDVILELHVPDFKKVKSFYKKLDFKIIWERKSQGEDGYLVLKRDKSVICFHCGNKNVYQHRYFSRFSSKSPKGYAVEISIPVKNIRKFYNAVQKNIGKQFVVEPLKTQQYDINKKKDFRIKDCFGFYLRFTEPINILYKE